MRSLEIWTLTGFQWQEGILLIIFVCDNVLWLYIKKKVSLSFRCTNYYLGFASNNTGGGKEWRHRWNKIGHDIIVEAEDGEIHNTILTPLTYILKFFIKKFF